MSKAHERQTETVADASRAVPPQTAGGEPADTEARIFAAALEVFARKGRDGARMREIADAAGINRALLHYYYRSKQQLYEAVFEHGFRQFVGSFGQALAAEPTFEDALRTFVHGYIDYIRGHQDMARLMVNECIREGSLLGEHLAAAFESPEPPPGRVMEERIARAIESGEIREVDPKHALLTIISACTFFFVALPTVKYLHPQAADDFDAFVEARKLHVVDLLLHGLGAESRGSS